MSQQQQQRRNAGVVAQSLKQLNKKAPPSTFLFLKAGLPLILFCFGASYVVKNAIEGKQKEFDASKKYVSK